MRTRDAVERARKILEEARKAVEPVELTFLEIVEEKLSGLREDISLRYHIPDPEGVRAGTFNPIPFWEVMENLMPKVKPVEQESRFIEWVACSLSIDPKRANQIVVSWKNADQIPAKDYHNARGSFGEWWARSTRAANAEKMRKQRAKEKN
jgi:hypothetical protein